MIRIMRPDAVNALQAIIVSLGAIPLEVGNAGLIIITPEQFQKCIEAAREGADQGCFHCGRMPAPHATVGGPMCSDCLSMCMD